MYLLGISLQDCSSTCMVGCAINGLGTTQYTWEKKFSVHITQSKLHTTRWTCSVPSSILPWLKAGQPGRKQSSQIPGNWHCILYTAQWTIHTAHCTLYTLYCTQYAVNCIPYTAQWKIHTAHIILNGDLTLIIHTSHWTCCKLLKGRFHKKKFKCKLFPNWPWPPPSYGQAGP